MSDEINKKLEQKLAGTGVLTSADMAAAPRDADNETDTGPVVGDVKVAAPKEEFDDPLVGTSRVEAPGTTLANNVPGVITDENMLETEITEKERNLFINAMVMGERFTLPFSLLGGAISGRIRSRRHKETTVILSQIQREIRDGTITVDAEYMARLRSMVLAAQIAVYNGEEEDELSEPLAWKRDSEGKLNPPGWLKQTEYWDNMDEGIAVLLHEEVRKFEVKYWMLVRQAEDQNFWKPATST